MTKLGNIFVYWYCFNIIILDRLLTFLTAFSTLVLKLSFSQCLSLHSHLSLPQADVEFDHSVFGSHWRR